ncbi:MAG: 6-phosphogluconolactonase, partial [Actinomycetia bacterium]|nr:6-phosphogluconolactonase [Actinomycetes bacterium]
GDPIILDLVQLGLGDDGHTASLIPNDPVLQVADRDTAWSENYKGHRRMTLTYPCINRAREILWLIAGDDKREAVAQVLAKDHSIPGGSIAQEQATLYLDQAAAANIDA